MWIEQWVGCTKSLSQWDILEEYARETHNQELSLDCLWRLQDWIGLKQTLSSKVVQCRGQPSRYAHFPPPTACVPAVMRSS
eukprot:1161053-Pelagomonas_calceolata.AAC.1